jgi:hypothetical protein
MSIIMEARTRDSAARDQPPGNELDPALRALLDHVAVELAEEYVRLMEEAAAADASLPTGINQGERGSVL